ncbi:MAG TPA: Gfo/Idh/MocA family oxidoreductase [Pirellulales bacterium]|nr:Gfo/Idh/MocA family oxidoreductase [Pirellulales bacterium]
MECRSNESLAHLRVAVVGYGSIGRRHCDNLAELGVGRRLLVRRNGDVNPALTPPDDAEVARCAREAIDAGIDLAIVCTPTSSHTSTARQYLAAGIPLLIEKPLSHCLADAEHFTHETRAAGTAVGMAYSMRYHPAYVLARDYVRQNRLGRIERARLWFESYLPDWHPWEDYRQSYAARADLGGGVLPTLDHEIDLANWCFGPPEKTCGASRRSGALEIDVDDAAEIRLNYATHDVEISLSFGRRERRRGFEFAGSEGRLTFSFERQRLEFWPAKGSLPEVLWERPDFDVNAIYVAMLRDALDAIVDGREPPVPLSAGLDALRVVDAVRRGGS